MLEILHNLTQVTQGAGNGGLVWGQSSSLHAPPPILEVQLDYLHKFHHKPSYLKHEISQTRLLSLALALAFAVIPKMYTGGGAAATFPANITSGAQLATRSPSSGWSAGESRWFAHVLTVPFVLISPGVGRKR